MSKVGGEARVLSQSNEKWQRYFIKFINFVTYTRNCGQGYLKSRRPRQKSKEQILFFSFPGSLHESVSFFCVAFLIQIWINFPRGKAKEEKKPETNVSEGKEGNKTRAKKKEIPKRLKNRYRILSFLPFLSLSRPNFLSSIFSIFLFWPNLFRLVLLLFFCYYSTIHSFLQELSWDNAYFSGVVGSRPLVEHLEYVFSTSVCAWLHYYSFRNDTRNMRARVRKTRRKTGQDKERKGMERTLETQILTLKRLCSAVHSQTPNTRNHSVQLFHSVP